MSCVDCGSDNVEWENEDNEKLCDECYTNRIESWFLIEGEDR